MCLYIGLFYIVMFWWWYLQESSSPIWFLLCIQIAHCRLACRIASYCITYSHCQHTEFSANLGLFIKSGQSSCLGGVCPAISALVLKNFLLCTSVSVDNGDSRTFWVRCYWLNLITSSSHCFMKSEGLRPTCVLGRHCHVHYAVVSSPF
jgi:hypothetical protein